ncbi:hypothetical protein QTP86_008542 [Hemibagrus guttatus]|nr:hypothetical protein QTP86_008542 [Hemibagrus guttatus]
MSLKRVGDLQALSAAPSCLEFAPGMVQTISDPRPGYIPKVPTAARQTVILQAFCLPPHELADQERLHWLGPHAAKNTTASARISACLVDISSWMTAHQLKLNPSKTELLIIPGDPSPAQDLVISLNNSMISPSATACNLGVTMDNQLSFSSHVTNVTRLCRFLLYNIRRIRPFLSTQATQVFVQSLVISRLDYCNTPLAGLPLKAIRPLQMIQSAAAPLVFNLPKFSHTTTLLHSLHWLPVASCIRFKTLMLAYKAKNGPAPSYLKALVTPHTVPRSLRSASTARLVPPSVREKGRHTSRLFSVLAPRRWNELPIGIRTAESLTVFKRQLKTYLFLNRSFQEIIQDGDESDYRQEVEQLAAWCSLNNLELNTLKTVEMIVDFRRNTPALPPLTIMNSTVPTVESFRFLGTTISQDLKWDTHIDATIKKAQQRLSFLRQLRKFNLPQELLTQFYSAVIESVLCTSITVWFGSATKSDIGRLQRTADHTEPFTAAVTTTKPRDSNQG